MACVTRVPLVLLCSRQSVRCTLTVEGEGEGASGLSPMAALLQESSAACAAGMTAASNGSGKQLGQGAGLEHGPGDASHAFPRVQNEISGSEEGPGLQHHGARNVEMAGPHRGAGDEQGAAAEPDAEEEREQGGQQGGSGRGEQGAVAVLGCEVRAGGEGAPRVSSAEKEQGAAAEPDAKDEGEQGGQQGRRKGGEQGAVAVLGCEVGEGKEGAPQVSSAEKEQGAAAEPDAEEEGEQGGQQGSSKGGEQGAVAVLGCEVGPGEEGAPQVSGAGKEQGAAAEPDAEEEEEQGGQQSGSGGGGQELVSKLPLSGQGSQGEAMDGTGRKTSVQADAAAAAIQAARESGEAVEAGSRESVDLEGVVADPGATASDQGSGTEGGSKDEGLACTIRGSCQAELQTGALEATERPAAAQAETQG